jgi:hypothetical protein
MEAQEWTAEEKLANTEEVLKQVTDKLEKMRQHRDRAQVEMDRLALELRQLQKKYVLLEELKNETEDTLRADIKFLIIKISKLQGKKNIKKDENNSPETKQVLQIEKDILSALSPNSVAKSLTKFVKNTPRSSKCSGTPFSSNKKSAFEDLIISSPPSECKKVIVPQFIKKSLMDVYSNQ